MKQITNTILLVQPKNVRSNEQTAVNNHYQKNPSAATSSSIQELAITEFNQFLKVLKNAGVNALVFESTDELDTPDAHFPNNWISFHENDSVVLYPMFAENRRKERRKSVLDFVEKNHFNIKNTVDYTKTEADNLFLEGTGSLLLDRANKKAYCALSQRADKELVIKFCKDFDYTPILFEANQSVNGKRTAIYHTNVMMCIAETFAVVCFDSIDNKEEKELVLKHLTENGKEIIDITEEQVNNFAGNLLQIIGKNQERYLVMSTSAFNAFTLDQKQSIERHTKIIHSPLDTIEMVGGGSARCMMAEVFLKQED